MSGPNKLTAVLHLEPMEARDTPSAGNVTVGMVNNAWLIRGDDNNNSILINEASPTSLRISGRSADGGVTKINGKAYIDIASSRPVSIDMRGGKDRVEVSGASAQAPVTFVGGLSINTGNDIDLVRLSYVKVPGTVSVSMGGGNQIGYENASLFGVDAGGVSYRTDRSGGSNNLSLTGSTVHGDVAIQGSAGSNSFTLASLMVSGSIRADMGSTPTQASLDTFQLTASTVGGGVDVRQSSGRGTVQFGNVTARSLSAALGYGYDQVLVNNSTADLASFDGGDGGTSGDRISGSGNHFRTSPQVRRFEVNQLR